MIKTLRALGLASLIGFPFAHAATAAEILTADSVEKVFNDFAAKRSGFPSWITTRNINNPLSTKDDNTLLHTACYR